MHIPEELIRIAQNDYMIDSDYLPDGELLILAARKLEYYMKMAEEYFEEVAYLRREVSRLEGWDVEYE